MRLSQRQHNRVIITDTDMAKFDLTTTGMEVVEAYGGHAKGKTCTSRQQSSVVVL